ncbi:MAG: hypothetical protein HOP19_08785 [Acidobacteria bacterium]|nr:hypothetical protein [Acidobacteriota bacterium]
MKKLALVITLFATGVSTGWSLARWQQPSVQSRALLENERVAVTEYSYGAQAKRTPYTRETDQVIVFIDDAEYDATDAQGKTQHKLRKRGEIVWHDKGEVAPTLLNTTKKPFRNVVIALK